MGDDESQEHSAPVSEGSSGMPRVGWLIRYLFGGALIVLAFILGIHAFQLQDESKSGTSSVTFKRAYKKVPGATKPRVVFQRKVVVNDPPDAGDRPEAIILTMLAVALFLGAIGAFVDRDKLALGWGKNKLEIGADDVAQVVANHAKPEATQQQVAVAAVKAKALTDEGTPLMEAVNAGLRAAEQLPSTAEAGEIAQVTANKGRHLSSTSVAVAAARATELVKSGTPLEEAAQRGVSEAQADATELVIKGERGEHDVDRD
jgi:hypothetical protein